MKGLKKTLTEKKLERKRKSLGAGDNSSKKLKVSEVNES